jgi:GLPGLI family protein
MISTLSFSQTGKITYTVKLMKNKKDSLNQEVKKIISDAKNIIFELDFNNDTSNYKKQENLENDNETGFNLTALLAGKNEKYYTSIANKKILCSTNSFGEKFIISKKFYEWKLYSETKKIGKYTCKKATTTRTIKGMNGDKTIHIISWYTNEIPVGFGPKDYSGLPGLVLQLIEVERKLVITATKIELNTKSKIHISEPKKGKKLNEQEFEDYLDNKLKSDEE